MLSLDSVGVSLNRAQGRIAGYTPAFLLQPSIATSQDRHGLAAVNHAANHMVAIAFCQRIPVVKVGRYKCGQLVFVPVIENVPHGSSLPLG